MPSRRLQDTGLSALGACLATGPNAASAIADFNLFSTSAKDGAWHEVEGDAAHEAWEEHYDTEVQSRYWYVCMQPVAPNCLRDAKRDCFTHVVFPPDQHRYNRSTGESSWLPPSSNNRRQAPLGGDAESAPAAAAAAISSTGAPSVTGPCEVPGGGGDSDGGWAEYVDPSSGHPYWYHTAMGLSSWECPHADPQPQPRHPQSPPPNVHGGGQLLRSRSTPSFAGGLSGGRGSGIARRERRAPTPLSRSERAEIFAEMKRRQRVEKEANAAAAAEEAERAAVAATAAAAAATEDESGGLTSPRARAAAMAAWRRRREDAYHTALGGADLRLPDGAGGAAVRGRRARGVCRLGGGVGADASEGPPTIVLATRAPPPPRPWALWRCERCGRRNPEPDCEGGSERKGEGDDEQGVTGHVARRERRQLQWRAAGSRVRYRPPGVGGAAEFDATILRVLYDGTGPARVKTPELSVGPSLGGNHHVEVAKGTGGHPLVAPGSRDAADGSSSASMACGVGSSSASMAAAPPPRPTAPPTERQLQAARAAATAAEAAAATAAANAARQRRAAEKAARERAEDRAVVGPQYLLCTAGGHTVHAAWHQLAPPSTSPAGCAPCAACGAPRTRLQPHHESEHGCNRAAAAAAGGGDGGDAGDSGDSHHRGVRDASDEWDNGEGGFGIAGFAGFGGAGGANGGNGSDDVRDAIVVMDAAGVPGAPASTMLSLVPEPLGASCSAQYLRFGSVTELTAEDAASAAAVLREV